MYRMSNGYLSLRVFPPRYFFRFGSRTFFSVLNTGHTGMCFQSSACVFIAKRKNFCALHTDACGTLPLKNCIRGMASLCSFHGIHVRTMVIYIYRQKLSQSRSVHSIHAGLQCVAFRTIDSQVCYSFFTLVQITSSCL